MNVRMFSFILGCAIVGAFFTPSFAQNTLPLNAIPYSRGPGVTTWAGMTPAANSIVATNGSNVPSLTTTLPTLVQSHITGLGTVTAGVWNATPINLALYSTGILPAASFPILTGDVGTPGGSLVTTIGAGRVTNSMLAGSIDLATKVTGILPNGNLSGSYTGITGVGALVAGSLNGLAVTGLSSPTVASDAANKAYVDSVASGVKNIGPSRLATAAVLPNSPTYSNGTAGVGATLTAGSNTTLTVDGTTANLADIILVWKQAAALQNGQYYVSAAGSGGAPWVLTRCDAAHCTSEFDSAATMLAGSYTFVTAGSTLINTAYTLLATVTTPGTTAVNFGLFSGTTAGVLSLGGQTGGLTCGTNVTCSGQIVSAPLAGSAGYISFNGSGNAFGADSNLFWDNSNKFMGVGTAAPGAKIQVGTRSTAVAPANISTIAAIGGTGSGANVFALTLGNTSAAALNNEVSINFSAASNFSATGQISTVITNSSTAASDMKFWTHNGTTLTEGMRLTSAGVLRLPLYTGCQAGLVGDASGNLICSGEAVSVVAYASAASTDPATLCSGTVPGQAALLAARAASKTVIIPVGCTLQISADTTFTAGGRLIVPCGATIKPLAEQTLLIRSIMDDPGVCQIFNGTCDSGSWPSGSGCGVVFGLKFNRPEWYSAKNDGATDDYPAFNFMSLAINASDISDGGPPTVKLSDGACYYLKSTVTLNPQYGRAINVIGGNHNKSCITGATAAHGGSFTIAILQIDGATPDTTDANMNWHLSGFLVQKEAAENDGIQCITFGAAGQEIASVGRNLIDNVITQNCQVGMGFYNTQRVTVRDVKILMPSAATYGDTIANNAVGLRFDNFDDNTFTGDIDFYDTQIECGGTKGGAAGSGRGKSIVMRASGTGVTVGGIRFHGAVQYYCDYYLYAEADGSGGSGPGATGSSGVGDVLFDGMSQWEGTGNNGAYIKTTGTTATIANMKFDQMYQTSLSGPAFTFVGTAISLGTIVGSIQDIMITNSRWRGNGAGLGDPPRWINALNVGNITVNGNQIEGFAPGGGASELILLNNVASAVIGNNMSPPESISPWSCFITASGTTDYVIANSNQMIGEIANNPILCSPPTHYRVWGNIPTTGEH